MTRVSLSERLAAAAEHSKQQLAALPARPSGTEPAKQTEQQVSKRVKPPKPPRIQFLVRLTEPAREAIREAAWREKLSEQEFIERLALSLTKVQ